MKQKAIQMLDIVYFLVTKYGYEQIKVNAKEDEFWLINKDRDKFNLIRLTTDSLASLKESKDKITVSADNAANRYNVKRDLLSIHFNFDDDNLFFEPGLYQAKINSETISPILTENFPQIQTAIEPIGTDLQAELNKRQMKFAQYSQRKQNINASVNRKMLAKEIRKNFKFSWVHGLMLINVIVFVAGLFVAVKTSDMFRLIFSGSLYKPLVYGANEWWRLIASGFVHADFFHILINMMALSQVGLLVERVYGKKQMLFIYFASMITGSLLALINMGSTYQTVGASGAIFGLMGAVVVYLYSSQLYKIPQVRNQIVSTLVINLLISFMPGISMYGHLGGFVGGVLAAMFISKSKALKAAKISSIISLVSITVAMTFYALFMDVNYFPTRVEQDKAIVASYYVLGFEKHANNLVEDYTNYYAKLGEKFE